MSACTPAGNIIDPLNSATAVTTHQGFRATFISTIDGDTIKVERHDDSGASAPITIRLLGLDAPEAKACGGPEATQYLTSLLTPGETVDVLYDSTADKIDRYDRTLAYIQRDIDPNEPLGASGEDVGILLAQTGNAEAWFPKSEPKPDRFDAYLNLNNFAEHQKLGAYARCGTVGRNR
ncbi:hypothetical protein ANMWB30_24470 [Arthrobacter sp. MWB30]|nr:hypothetical protein ANMWB30_24470 [Arthrobacter sp. MWB30]